MTLQEIRTCTAADGVRIGYATLGDGPPLVYVRGWPVHLELEWEKSFIREFLIELSRGFRLIRYDMRGGGLSDRKVTELTIRTLIRDLEAVADHLALERFALLSLGNLGGPLAVSYAVAHSDRVSRMILYSAFAKGADLAPAERQRTFIDCVANYGFPLFEFVDDPGCCHGCCQTLGREGSLRLDRPISDTKTGANGEIRTLDLRFTKPLLS